MSKQANRLTGKTVRLNNQSHQRASVPEDLLHRLAGVAAVPTNKHQAFRSILMGALKEAFRAHAAGRRKALTISDVRPHFERVRKALQALGPEQSGEPAGIYLEAVIAPQTLEEWQDSIDRAERFATRLLPGRGATKGPRGDTGFSLFVHSVVIGVRVIGGRLTCSRMGGRDHLRIKGSFADMLELLGSHLPKNFMPKSARAIVATFDRANKSAI